jgi:periplasmic divalent cation tolerance protein
VTNAALVLTTVGEEADADALARLLVEERLAACVAIGAPMRSVYRWKGAIERSTERQLTIKTTTARLPALEKRLAELHPYELPELLVIDVAQGSEAYLAWMAAVTRAE